MKSIIKYSLPFFLVSLLFMMWGAANNMNDTLLAAFKRIMSMSDLQTSLVQSAFYGAYFCFAIPAAMFIRRFSFKSGILLGLFLYALGTLLFFPAGEAASYPFFLCAIYIMAGGCAILETTANPYVLEMGTPETATRRLNIAQTFMPIGSIAGILLSRHFILSELNEASASERSGMGIHELETIQHHELTAISGTYMIIGCVLLILLAIIALTKMPSEHSDRQAPGMLKTFRELLHNRKYSYGVIAQFFYVGAQTGVWSFTIRLAMSELGIYEKEASMIFLYSILAFSASRFFFTWLMGYVKPIKLLVGTSVMAILLSLSVIMGDGWTSVVCLIAISACMSLMFPTIYGISLEGIHGENVKVAASGQIMAILGGAVITPLQALISDNFGISVSFLVPMICFAVILIYSSMVGIYSSSTTN